MNWIEMIQLKSFTCQDKESAVAAFQQLTAPLSDASLRDTDLFKSPHLENELSILINWYGEMPPNGKSGLDPRALEAVNSSLATELRDIEHMELMGQLTIQGNLPCAFCVKGQACEMSGFQRHYGPDAKTSEIRYNRVEDNEKVWAEAARIGCQIGERIQKA